MAFRPNTLNEHKIKASILLKRLRAEDPEAATRLGRLPHLAGLSVGGVLEQKHTIKRKHALAVVALERGYASWSELKHALEGQGRGNDDALLYPPHCDVFLNNWFASYEEAQAYLREAGGYLLPYKHQFFVCQAGHIEALGLEPEDSDWARIGWDWARPADEGAWERLNAKLRGLEP